jgi:hypothetical protein
MGLVATSQFHFIVSTLEVCQELFFIFHKSNEGGRVVTSVIVWILFEFNRKICFWILLCVVCFLADSIFPLSIFLLRPSALLQTGPHSFFVDYVPRVFVSGVARRLGPVRRSQCCQREVCFGAFFVGFRVSFLRCCYRSGLGLQDSFWF